MNILKKPLIYSNKPQTNSHSTRLRLIRDNDSEVSENYKTFGKDYYDNPNVLQGFGGYKYDGRYASCAQNLCDMVEFQYILDFGCAKGFLLYEFLKLSKNVVGVDISDYARKNSKKEVKSFLYREIMDVPKDILLNIEIILTRDVFPHLEHDSLFRLLGFIQNSCPKLKLFYIEVVVSEDPVSEKALLDWDPTHQLIQSKEQWNDFFMKFELPISVYYKNLFSTI